MGIPHAAAGNDGQAEERYLLTGENCGAAAIPNRLAVRATDQVPGKRFDPFFIDLGYGAGIPLRRLHEFGSNDPLGTRAERAAAGPEEKLIAPGSQVFAGVGLRRDAGEQTGEEGAVDGGVNAVAGERARGVALCGRPI